MRMALFQRRKLSISTLLAVGFSLLCGLTVLLAGTAVFSLNSVLIGEARLAAITSTHASILKARVAEKAYQIGGQSTNQEAVLATMQEVQTSLDLSLEGSQRLALASQDYLAQFETLANTRRRASETRVRMGTQAEAVRSEFEVVEQDLIEALSTALSDGTASDRAIALADSAIALTRKLMAVRTSEWLLSLHPSKEHYEQWMLLVSDLNSSAQALADGAAEQQRAALESAMQALAQYRQAFDEFRASTVLNMEAELAMDTIAQQMLNESDALQERIVASQYRSNQRAFYVLLGMTLVSVLLSVIAALVIRRQIVVPLRYTASMVSQVALGQLNVDVQHNRKDELGQVMQAMQQMTENLHGIVRKIESGTRQVNLATSNLTRITDETSDRMQAQSLETDKTATAMLQMNTTLGEVARSTDLTLQAARSARDGSAAGSRDVLAVVEQIQQLSVQMDDASLGMQSLDEQSTRISRVLDVIRELAEQTNLLALNAAIEAARAGEQGRGFSVVADEVRNLANRTQACAGEIGGMIEALQHETKEAVSKIGRAREQSVYAQTLSSQANAALIRVAEDVSTMHEMNQQIAAATEQQCQVAEDVSRSMVNVRDTTEQNHSCNQQLRAASSDLTRLGQELQLILNYFNLT
ncbi:Methyl-accepting chemotaxis protein McpS [compost metagenome]